MRKPQVEHFWNYIMYTHFGSPTGCCGTNRLISFVLFLMSGSESVHQNGSGVPSWIWTGTAQTFYFISESWNGDKEPSVKCYISPRILSGNGCAERDGFVTCLDDSWTSLLLLTGLTRKTNVLLQVTFTAPSSFLQQRVSGKGWTFSVWRKNRL